jgi:reactive intermediate/imine deaminase
MITKALLVPGLPQVLLAPEKNPGWNKLNAAYSAARKEIAESNADLILYCSTQWLSVLGYTFQADPSPEWTHVDHNFHELGSMSYRFRIDADFARTYAAEVKLDGHHTMLANYKGFPIDTGTIVAQKLLNPDNRLPAAMVSCNMYAEKAETVEIGRSGLRALEKSGKRAIAVLVSTLSNRFFTTEVDPRDDRISSAKDDEWNRKICELLGEGRLEDVAQVARDFGREANGDMGFKGVWWLNGLCGESNDFRGHFYDYQPIYGTGGAVISLTPTKPVRAPQRAASPQPAPTAHSHPHTVADHTLVGAHGGSTADQARVIETIAAPEPVGAYPHARREGDFLFLSGVGPRARGRKEIPGVTQGENGEIVAYDVEVQTRSVIENVKAVLAAAGSSLEQVVDVQVFLTNMKQDFPTFNRVYAEYFGKIQATRTTVEVGALPTPIAVEFKVIARA